jgi:hypothetical protein
VLISSGVGLLVGVGADVVGAGVGESLVSEGTGLAEGVLELQPARTTAAAAALTRGRRRMTTDGKASWPVLRVFAPEPRRSGDPGL